MTTSWLIGPVTLWPGSAGWPVRLCSMASVASGGGSSGFQFDSAGSPYFRYKATMRHLSCIQNALRPKGACFLPDFPEKFILAALL